MFILGLQIDPPHLRGALVLKTRKGIEVKALRFGPLANPEHVKQLYMHDFRGKIVSGLSAKDFFIRHIQMKMANHKHVREALAFQTEATSHFNPQDILTVPFLVRKDKETIDATLTHAPRHLIRAHLEECAKIGADPDLIHTTSSALCLFAIWKFPAVTDALIVDLGSNEWTCVLMENSKLKKSHSIPGGNESLLSALLKDRKKVLLPKEVEGAAKLLDLLLLKAPLTPNLTHQLQALKQELYKTQKSFQKEGPPIPLIVTGETDAFIHLNEFLFESLPHSKVLFAEEQKYATAIGLALAQTRSDSIQLRQDEFFPQKNWRKLGLFATTLFAIALFFSGVLLFSGIQSIHSKKQALLTSILPSLQRGGLKGSIDQWIATIEANNKEYPYIPQAPTVTEVLTWLSSHPLLQQVAQEGDPIDILDIHYQMVKCPKVERTKEPYLAKVAIEFRFKNAMNARKLHETIREGDPKIDTKSEITWDVLHDSYRISFFLNNRQAP